MDSNEPVNSNPYPNENLTNLSSLTNTEIVSDVIVSQVNSLNISGESTQTLTETSNAEEDKNSGLNENKVASCSLIEEATTTNIFNKESIRVDHDTSNKDLEIEANKGLPGDSTNINISTIKPIIPATIKSTVILNRKSDSLRNLLTYNSDSDDSGTPCSVSDYSEDDTDQKVHVNNKANWQPRIPAESGTSESESDSTVGVDDDDDSSTDNECSADEIGTCSDSDESVKITNVIIPKKPTPHAKPKEQIKEEDLLPPVPNLETLNLNLENEDFLHMGHVAAIVDKLVTVEALPGVPAYDLDSYFFIEKENAKKPLGQIFDVLGPVTAPLYCIRFNTVQDIQDLKLVKGMEVFVAPKSEYSKYVFLSELMKLKGTDASWKDDQERPDDCEDFSDDEKEREAKSGSKRTSLKRRHGSLERHQQYERRMNQSNVLNTKVNRLLDGPNHFRLQQSGSPRPMYRGRTNNFHGVAANSFSRFSSQPSVPAFDPSVPPPGFGSPQSGPPNAPNARLSDIPPHLHGAPFHPDQNVWRTPFSGDQAMRFPPRSHRGRGSSLLNRPNYGFNPPGPSSNHF